jgi:hypothetical protein
MGARLHRTTDNAYPGDDHSYFQPDSVLSISINSRPHRNGVRPDFDSSDHENMAMTRREGSCLTAYHYTLAGTRQGQSRGWMRAGGRMPTAWKAAWALPWSSVRTR